MSGKKMSQEDIDKLLKGEMVVEENVVAVEEYKSQVEILKEEKEKIKSKDLTSEEKDVLGEIANISFGAASTTLSTVLNKQVTITTPRVSVVRESLVDKNEAPFVVLNVNYVKGLDIDNLLVIKKDVAHVIADLMMGGDGVVAQGKEIGEMELSAVQEAMNQMMGAAATSMSEVFGRMVDISPPTIRVLDQDEVESQEFKEKTFVTITFDLDVVGAVKSKLVQVISLDSAQKMAKDLMSVMDSTSNDKKVESEDDLELTKTEKDAIGELANMSFGAASTSLSAILNHKVSITTPHIEVVEVNNIEDGELPHVVLNVSYTKGLDMQNLLVIKKHVASVIADLMMGGTGDIEEGKEIGEMELSAVQEAMNQMMGASATAMSEIFERIVDISPPSISLNELQPEIQKLSTIEGRKKIVKISFDLDIGGIIKSKLIQAISLGEAKKLTRQLMEIMNPNETVDENQGGNDKLTEPISDAFDGVEPGSSLRNEISPLLKDVKVKVEVIFGNTQKPLKEILAMAKDDIVALQEDVGELLKIYANGVMIAEGEIVNIDGHFGVEIKKIKSQF